MTSIIATNADGGPGVRQLHSLLFVALRCRATVAGAINSAVIGASMIVGERGCVVGDRGLKWGSVDHAAR